MNTPLAALRPSPTDARKRKRSRLRRISGWLLLTAVVYSVPVLLGWMNAAAPVDYAMNVFPYAHRAELCAPRQDGVRRMVVLQHGLWRSPGSLWKLERALADHGYEVWNPSYPSTSGTIAEHAERLHQGLEQYLARDPARAPRLHFVGHSLGGLVIRRYLERPAARQAEAVVFIATPQRGAMLCDLRRDSMLFKMLMGDQAALELSPHAPCWSQLQPLRCDAGVIVGGMGNSLGKHADIPGDDDGTVAVAETMLENAKDTIMLPIGHTRISFDDRVITQVLWFLRDRRFRHG